MGSLCGQVNMAWRMNHSTVTLFLFPLLQKQTGLKWRPAQMNAKPSNAFLASTYSNITDSLQGLQMIKTPEDINVAQQWYRRGFLKNVVLLKLCIRDAVPFLSEENTCI